MAIKKVRIKPPGYTDIVHPETSADIVIETDDKKVMTSAERTKLAGIDTEATKTEIVDGLTSTDATKVLSAKQGKVLKDLVDSKWVYNEDTIRNVKVKNADDADTVTGKTVGKDVPVNAVFTDTTYMEIPESEINLGTSSTLRTITGRRVKYILDKIQGWLNNKVDKIEGKGLSTEDYTTDEKDKLAGIESGANKYTHPSTHPASMITESTTKRFVSDTDKANWDAKETPAGAQAKANTAESNAKAYADSIKPTNITNNELHLGNYRLVYNTTENSLDVEVVA